PMGRGSGITEPGAVVAEPTHTMVQQKEGEEAGAGPTGESAPPEPRGVGEAASTPTEVSMPASGGARKPARYGLSILFESRPDDAELARLVETTVWINEAHPAYRRAAASRAAGYHVPPATAMALAPLDGDPAHEPTVPTGLPA